ncbi:TldD/PmbA family protein [Streptomyces sp. NBC_01408]|uniref:TldD/PmbA family protein n=1 Tax=Streptomyces sp. NBC_01408 TaxID=2903855 RepID=UPI00224DF6D3|nr:TldD/PmbA family protein [Streptomyces sp. NBC_01408]MCX4692828.1 TldD/PmbA family protein [Streptomyces sp. NBC_01408]
MSEGTADGGGAERLLELAQWAVECLQGSADYVQVYAESTVEVRVECLDGDVLATCVEPREGLGCMVRKDDRWRHRAFSVTELGSLPSWLGTAPQDGPDGIGVRWPEREDVDFTPVAARDWLVQDARTPHSLRTTEDFTARTVAVADTEGVRAASVSRLVRRRLEATVTTDGGHYRGLNRWLERGPTAGRGAGSDATLPREVAREALGHARDSALAALRGNRRTPVVFGPTAAVGFLHELVGHALEGDNFAMRSDYIAALRKPGAVPAVLSLYDDATLADGYGSYAIDDEGNTGRTTVLVANGEIGSPLTSVRAAQRHGYTPTANGRRRDYRELPLPRASNTVVRPGSEDPAALLEAGSEGVLHVGCLGAGMINLATGEFSFAALNCSYITPDGHRVPVRDVSIFGDALDVLGRIEAIGSDFGGDSITCGKQGQMIGIGLFSPSMRYSALDWSAA